MLTGEQILELGLLSNSTDDNFRGASYDLRAGKIIKPGGEVVTEYVVPPQGIVEIVSAEVIKLPADVCGFAAVKTSLSTQGLLALNIGLIDPLYDGPIASFLLNFSKIDILVGEGDVFLRTHFTKLQNETKRAKESTITEVDYVKDRRRKITGKFGSTFLNIDQIVDDIVKQYAVKALLFVGAIALLITFSAYLTNVGSVNALRGWIDPTRSIRDEVHESVNQDLAAARVETAQLRGEIASLRNCLRQERDQLNSSKREPRVRC